MCITFPELSSLHNTWDQTFQEYHLLSLLDLSLTSLHILVATGGIQDREGMDLHGFRLLAQRKRRLGNRKPPPAPGQAMDPEKESERAEERWLIY